MSFRRPWPSYRSRLSGIGGAYATFANACYGLSSTVSWPCMLCWWAHGTAAFYSFKGLIQDITAHRNTYLFYWGSVTAAMLNVKYSILCYNCLGNIGLMPIDYGWALLQPATKRSAQSRWAPEYRYAAPYRVLYSTCGTATVCLILYLYGQEAGSARRRVGRTTVGYFLVRWQA